MGDKSMSRAAGCARNYLSSPLKATLVFNIREDVAYENGDLPTMRNHFESWVQSDLNDEIGNEIRERDLRRGDEHVDFIHRIHNT